MSLFKARDFWTVVCDTSEQFDQHSLKKSKFGSDEDYIITGSHYGVLRIFKPSSEVQEDGKVTGFKATDLLIEQMLPQPILQVADGRLISGSNQVQLAVLHPKIVSVFTLTSKDGAAEHGTQHSLQLLYEHKLRRSAFNFLIGPFGGSSNRDFLCVQSLDGLLSFFEQESFSFCCFLPDFLIPVPICYLFRADVFVTVGSDWLLRAFRYRKLSEAGHNSNQGDATGKKAESCWELNVGENVVDLKVAKHISGKQTVVALGERNFYGISEGGKVLFMKHLEYSPICFNCFALGEDDRIVSMIVSETSTLLIYHGTSLKWSANLSFLPICIERIFLKHVKGAVVSLSEEGQLNCSYLGTQPSVFVAPPLNNQIDFEKAISDLEEYNKFIRENNLEENTLITGAKLEKDLTISVRVNEELQKLVLESEQEVGACEIIVEMTPLASLKEVQLIVCAEESFVVVPEVSFYSTLSEKELAQFLVYGRKDKNVNSLQIDVIITFTTNSGTPKVSQQIVRVPFKLIAETCSPQKEAAHKIVLCMNRPSVPLNTIFSEFPADQLTNNSAAFITNSTSTVTVLLAKTSERYRVQSDSMLSLNVVVEELIHRLTNYYYKTKEFAITFSSSLPVPQVLKYVNQHFASRQEVITLEREIIFLTAQFRIIQKRLISKFKAKSPTPLIHLEVVLDDTLDLIMDTTTNLEKARRKLQIAQSNLSYILCLILNLMQIMDVKHDVLKNLWGAFCPSVKDIDGQNWEDTVDASACFLLRTVLAKTEKDKLRAPHTSFEEIKDIVKVEKHITQVLERVAKKGDLLETHFPAEEEATNVSKEITNTLDPVEKVPEKETVPVGSQIGQASSRILSARTSLLQKRHRLQQHLQKEEES